MLAPLPAFAYSATPKSMALKSPSRGGSRKIEYDKSSGRTPGADSYGEGEEQIPNSGRFGLEGKYAPPKRNFYGPKLVSKGASKKSPQLEELASEFESDESDLVVLAAAGLIGFLVGSGVTFALFRHRFVPFAATPLMSA